MAKRRLAARIAALVGGRRQESRRDGTPEDCGEVAYRPRRMVGQGAVLREDQGLFGKVYILSLTEFYEAIGSRTGRLAESLTVICDTVFRERLGPNDRFSPIGEDEYLFRFGGLDDRQALIRAAILVEEIGTKVLGEHFVKSGRLRAMLTAVGAGDIVDTDGKVDASKIATAVALARRLPPAPAAAGDPAWVRLAYAGRTADNEWVAVPGGQRDSVHWAALDHGPAQREIRWEAIEPAKKKKDEAPQWEALTHERRTDEVRWQVLEREKKESSLDWRPLRVPRPD